MFRFDVSSKWKPSWQAKPWNAAISSSFSDTVPTPQFKHTSLVCAAHYTAASHGVRNSSEAWQQPREKETQEARTSLDRSQPPEENGQRTWEMPSANSQRAYWETPWFNSSFSWREEALENRDHPIGCSVHLLPYRYSGDDAGRVGENRCRWAYSNFPRPRRQFESCRSSKFLFRAIFWQWRYTSWFLHSVNYCWTGISVISSDFWEVW